MTVKTLSWSVENQAIFNRLATNTSVYEAVKTFKELTTPAVVLRMVEIHLRPPSTKAK